MYNLYLQLIILIFLYMLYVNMCGLILVEKLLKLPIFWIYQIKLYNIYLYKGTVNQTAWKYRLQGTMMMIMCFKHYCANQRIVRIKLKKQSNIVLVKQWIMFQRPALVYMARHPLAPPPAVCLIISLSSWLTLFFNLNSTVRVRYCLIFIFYAT